MPNDDPADQLKKLADLRAQGVLSEAEFTALLPGHRSDLGVVMRSRCPKPYLSARRNDGNGRAENGEA